MKVYDIYNGDGVRMRRVFYFGLVQDIIHDSGNTLFYTVRDEV